MTGPWTQTEVLIRIAGALERFVWQGAAIGALFGAANALLSRAAPRVRYALGCAALALMLTAPLATLATAASRAPATTPTAAAAAETSRELARSASPALRTVPAGPRATETLAPWLVGGWLCGVAALSLRLAASWASVERLRRRFSRPASPALEARLRAVAARMRVSRPVRLLECAAMRVPGAIGALRPAILLPAGIATGLAAGQLDALLAHELAHVARRDYLVHLLQAVAETLLFFHPAVWWVSHRIRVEREHACDDLALAATGDALLYARSLLALEERRRDSAWLAEADGRSLVLAADGASLSARIRRLIAGETPPAAPGIAAVLALTSAAALGAAAGVPATAPAALSVAAWVPASAPSTAARPDPSPAQGTAAPTPHPSASRRSGKNGVAPRARETEASDAAGPTADDLIAYRIHGVTPEFIESIRAEGFDHPTPDDLLALRIHGVTPEYLRAMTAELGRQPLEDYVAFRIHGLTPERVAELRATFGHLSADDALAMRIHGVTPEFVREMRDAGFPKLGAAVAFRIHGVTPEFARDMREAGFARLDADEAVAFRIHGVTPEFAKEMRALVSAGVNADDLVAFRIHGVTPEFVRQIHELGYAGISGDDLVAFRIHGLTPAVIRDLNARAGGRLSPDDLVERRILRGADEEEEP